MAGKTALEHITEAHNQWTQSHPDGFVATPVKTGSDPSSVNLMEWSCYIPGKAGDQDAYKRVRQQVEYYASLPPP
ncbi:hypothetical protein P3L10_031737 [Capsicum annuum]